MCGLGMIAMQNTIRRPILVTHICQLSREQMHFRHCGLNPQSPQIGAAAGIPGQARDDMFTCFEKRHNNRSKSTAGN